MQFYLFFQKMNLFLQNELACPLPPPPKMRSFQKGINTLEKYIETTPEPNKSSGSECNLTFFLSAPLSFAAT